MAKFNRYNRSDLFTPDIIDNHGIALFLPNYDSDTAEFNNDFIKNQSNKWLFLFFPKSSSLDRFNNTTAKNTLDAINEDDYSSSILWVDELEVKDDFFDDSGRMLLKGDTVSYTKLTPTQTRNTEFKFKIRNIQGGRIIFNGQDFEINSPEDKNFELIINQQKSLFSNFKIGVLDMKSSLFFESTFDKDNGLPILIPYVSKRKYDAFVEDKRLDRSSEFEPLTSTTLIDHKDLSGSNLQCAITPFDKNFQSSFRFISNTRSKNIPCNISSLKGEKLLINDISNIEFQINRIKLIEDSRYDRFTMTPRSGQIELQSHEEESNSLEILLGNSGTESLSFHNEKKSVTVRFEEDKLLLVNDKNYESNPEKLLDKLNDSKTSRIAIIGESDYRLDSQRYPFFGNSISSIYVPIKRSSINFEGNELFPIIPTFSLEEGNKDLMEIDRIFSRLRLDKAKKQAVYPKAIKSFNEASYITPQGFTKNGSRIDFKKSERTVKSDGTTFEFSLDNYGEDFDLSLRKDQIFFVLTPKLFEQAKKASGGNTNIELKAKFSVNNAVDANLQFVVDMWDAYGNGDDPISTSNEESIIIFKFHNKSLNELINDDTSWSNDGKELRNGLSDIKKKVREIIDAQGNDPDNALGDNYLYDVKDDRTWNGIIILNVPIINRDNLPKIFSGLSASQDLGSGTSKNLLALNTGLKFNYVALPVNKTFVNDKKVEIKSSAFFGLIDYNPFKDLKDFQTIAEYFKPDKLELDDPFKFILSKLYVKFENSEIRNFESFAFLQIPRLFDNTVKIKPFPLSHDDKIPDCTSADVTCRPNLVRLDGIYQKTKDKEEFTFNAELNGSIEFDEKNLISKIEIKKIGFTHDGVNDEFRFDLNASVEKGSWLDIDNYDFISIDELTFENIGLKFKLDTSILPDIKLDFSNLAIFPKINFNGKGFLSSFPIKFSHFQIFHFKAGSVNNDFFTFFSKELKLNDRIFSLVFDFDLGTLGDLEVLKALKGQLYFGWTGAKGFALGFKLAGPSSKGLNLDLFGALKIEIKEVSFGKFNPKRSGKEEDCTAFFLRLNDARIKMFGTNLPSSDRKFNGIIISDFSKDKKDKKIAWLINYNDNKDKLLLGVGQRMGPPIDINLRTTVDAIKRSSTTFSNNLTSKDCNKISENLDSYQPDRNWLVASGGVFELLGSGWNNVIDLKFIFNDPVLYGLYLKILGEGGWGGLSIDILYKKMSDNLGVWTAELVLPDSVRYQDIGGGAFTFPNFGVDVFTNGDWKLDIGYPVTTADWSRSGQLQILPLVGWFGIYVTKVRTVALSIFGPYENHKEYGELLKRCDIVQVGFAFRIGLGKYFHKGPLHAGASISVYSVMEGAFAFDTTQNGISRLLPDHFAFRGRVGAIAEIVGYVDFKIVKAGVHAFLQVEAGMLLAVINGRLQPVPLYIEGRVGVRIRVTIRCFKIFRKKICIRITFKFYTTLRFSYTLGGGNNKQLQFKSTIEQLENNSIKVPIKEVPVIYMPGLTKSLDKDGNEILVLVHNFAINIFGYKFQDDKLHFSESNILKSKILLPIFETLISAGLTSYESLRAALIDSQIKQNSDVENIELRFPDFIPTVHYGYSFEDDSAKEFVMPYLDQDESKYNEFKKAIENNVCDNDPEKCPFRPIPVPITGRISLRGKDGSIDDYNNGFEISTKELFKDTKGIAEIKTKIEGIPLTEDEIKQIEQHFDGYKTQFFERKSKELEELDSNKDLRQDLTVPEYFKLLALLTLEACYQEFLDNVKNKKNENHVDPAIAIIVENDITKLRFTSPEAEAGYEKEASSVDPNDVIESAVIGQLNYFYNSGLRLYDPKSKKDSPRTKPYFEALELTEAIELNDNIDRNKVDIEFIGKIDDGTQTSVSLKADWFQDRKDLDDFIKESKQFRDKLSINKLVNEFNSDRDRIDNIPFRLNDLNLSIAGTKISVDSRGVSIGHSFYEIPQRLISLGKDRNITDKDLSFKLSLKGDDDSSGKIISYVPCANLEITVRINPSQKSKNLVEISNVYLEDLNLINRIVNEKNPIAQIKLYQKPKADDKNPVELGIIERATIIKTNLSKRTFPPVIIERERLKKIAIDSDLYFAVSADHENFVQLVWQGLTTNNGGYYLVLPEDIDFKEDSKLVLSIEYQQYVSPHFCNYLKVENNKDSNKIKNDDTLFVLEDIKQGNKVVKEYHPIIPPHCMSFSLERTVTNDYSEQFLPLEFEVKREGISKPILSYEQVLPINPKNQIVRDEKGNPIMEEGVVKLSDNNLIYEHVTPLHDKVHKHKYQSIGKKFTFSFGLRDLYGHRVANDFLTIENYKHRYFDKLIPASSWPFIEVSTQFQRIDGNNVLWNLVISADKKSYNNHVKDDDSRESILNQLSLIIDQLEDPRCQIKIDAGDKSSDKIPSISDYKKKQIIELLRSFGSGADIHPIEMEYKLKISGLKTLIHAALVIERVPDSTDNDLFIIPENSLDPKDQVRIVETEAIKSVSTPIPLESGLGESDIVNRLQKLLKRVKPKFTIGIGQTHNGDRGLFFVSTEELDKVFSSIPNRINKENYIGVKPISNKLWTGKYKGKSFTNIDLDSGLRLILNRVDGLLNTKNILNIYQDENGENLKNLLKAKNKLVSNSGSGFSLTSFVQYVDAKKSQNIETFNDQIAKRLNDFYNFDGIISVPLKSSSNTLEGHRFSLSSANENPEYDIVLGKVYFKEAEKGADFTALFDHKLNNKSAIAPEPHNLTIKPRISHIEYDIDSVSGTEIEESKWIQLIEQYSPLTDKSISIEKFPAIVREFPDKPKIKTHSAKPASESPKVWSDNVGEWDYFLGIVEDADKNGKTRYFKGDILTIKLNYKFLDSNQKLHSDSHEQMKGFIAYWSSRLIEDSKINDSTFIEELLNAINAGSDDEEKSYIGEDTYTIFRLLKEKGGWKPLKPSNNWLKLKSINSDGYVDINNLMFTGANIFDEEKDIISIHPEISVSRNTVNIGNENFHYQTETVSPNNWVTPLISLSKPIKLDKGTFEEDVFKNVISKTKLPFKTTAKFLINTSSDEKFDKFNILPTIPLVQTEIINKNGGQVPDNPDGIFEGYKNGYPAYSITVYNREGESELPVFTAETIFKIENGF